MFATGKLRDGGAEVVECWGSPRTLREDRALLEAEVVNEGEVETADEKSAEMLAEIVEALAEAAEPMRKRALAAALALIPRTEPLSALWKSALNGVAWSGRSAARTRSEGARMTQCSRHVPPSSRQGNRFPPSPPKGKGNRGNLPPAPARFPQGSR